MHYLPREKMLLVLARQQVLCVRHEALRDVPRGHLLHLALEPFDQRRGEARAPPRDAERFMRCARGGGALSADVSNTASQPVRS